MINAQENEIELILTYECNWNCEYCCVDTHAQNNITPEQIIEKLNKVTPGWNVTLSGGEIGLMKKEDILFVLDFLDDIGCPISLNTNGLFLTKYKDLLHRFEYILYHCSEDLVTKPKFITPPEHTKLDYMLVITDNNIQHLDSFLTRYNNIEFHVVAATQPEGGLDVTLSNENRYKIMKKRYKNISKESLSRLIIKEKNWNSIIYL